jgi:parallel beta-helix repeat protein
MPQSFHRLRCFLLVWTFVFFGTCGWAAIAFDAASSSSSAAAANTITWSHTIGGGTNRLLVVCIAREAPNLTKLGVSSITYNGVALTLVAGSVSDTGAATLNRAELYYALDASLPSTGAYPVIINFGGAAAGGGIVVSAISLSGVKQQAAEAVAINTTASTTTLTTNITTLTANAWVVDVVCNSGIGNAFAVNAANMTERMDANSTLNSGASSTKTTTTAGVTAMSWNYTGSTQTAHSVAAFAPWVPKQTLSGNVFEDTGYGGGVGRNKATAFGVNCLGARVELYNSAGAFESATTTDASGNYSLLADQNSTCTVRVVSSSVTSSLGGSGLIPVQTYRTTATSGSPVAVTDRVGGETPNLADAGNGSTTLAALTAGSLTPQSITSVTVSTSDITGLDFGFNFNTIVNTNDSGQGSFRQMITNSSAMSGTQTTTFMISDGSAHAGLRAGLTNQLTSGVAVITPATQLPTPSDAIIYDATTQTTNIGNTNSGTMGTGGTVGVDGLTLSTVNRPEVELVGNSGIGSGILMGISNSTLKGFAIHGFGNGFGQGDVVVGGTGLTITQNVIGTTATSFSLPGSAASGATAIRVNPATGTISNNLIGFTAYYGILFFSGATPMTVSNNELRGCGRSGSGAGMFLAGTGLSISQNLFAANKGNGVDIDSTASASSAQSMVNNSFTGNGVGTVGTLLTAAIRLYGNSNVVDRNIIAQNYGAGIAVTSGSTGNKFTGNSIYSNGTITNDSAQAATAQVGIDLLSATDDVNLGTASYYTINDSGDGDSGGNNLLNFPVLNTAIISGSNITLTGWARPGSIIEFFISDGAASGFGQGQTYLTTLTEGSGGDADATTSAYTNPVNGLNQGADTTNKFSFTIATPGGVSVGTKLTATATDASNNTSEFSGQVTVTAAITLSGNVFEDTGYSGGVGRSFIAASGTNVAGARVELFDNSGNYVSAATTDASGNYSLSSITASTSYTIRVVNSTVASSLGGSSLLPVQTYRTTATTGSAVAVTDRVGGEDPAKADAGNGATTLAALTAGSVLPQSITAATVTNSAISGLDFGYNFNTIVNTNDTGQGSLRQMITNANGMSGTQTTVFMISNGSAHAGLRAGLTNQLTGGVAVITPATILPSITGALTIDGTSQTTNIGDTNAGTLGTGGTVGVNGVALSTLNRPEVEIVGSNSIASGLDIEAVNCTIKGISIHGFGGVSADGDITTGTFSTHTITQNIIGATASSFSAPAAASGGNGVHIGHSNNGSFTNNLVGFTAYNGINITNSADTGWTVQNNEFRGCGTASSNYGGIDFFGGTAHTITGNLFIANKGQGIDAHTAVGGSLTILNNTITGNGIGNASLGESAGIRLMNSNNTVDRNIISSNYGPGVMIGSDAIGNKITRNIIYSNGTILSGGGAAASGQIGIDLLSSTDTTNRGTAPYYTLNDDGDADTGGNDLLNYPVLDNAMIIGSNLEISGWAPTGATLEFFIANGSANFGQGQTYIGSVVEGSGSDTDATSSSYSGNVNCFAQGSGTTVHRFKYTFADPGGITPGTTKLTATATDGSNNTSEFSGNITVYNSSPIFTIVSSSTTISDPVNNATNPKAIPGGVLLFTATITNSYQACNDADSFVYTNPIPANTKLYVGNLGGAGSGPISFTDGATSSAVTYTFTSLSSTTDDLSFSNDSGATWTYVPTLDADSCDANVTNLRINPKGTFAKSACGNNPSCVFEYRLHLK